jgi:periplasmic mercuric ion binding protein
MKTLKALIVTIAALLVFQSSNAQSDKSERTIGIKTQTIKVSGTCSMDKRRIETAANSIDGVKSAIWNEYTQILTLKYSVFKKDAADNVQKKIAFVGNDTEKYRADDAVYQKLPDCCHYQRKNS